MTETQFKEQVIKDLKTLDDCWFLKTQERAHRGIPDILICYRGDFVAIELKRDGKEPDKLQALTLERISKAGGTAFFATPKTWPTQLILLREWRR